VRVEDAAGNISSAGGSVTQVGTSNVEVYKHTSGTAPAGSIQGVSFRNITEAQKGNLWTALAGRDEAEGVFLPTVSFATNGDFSPTYTVQGGRYWKKGKLVYISLAVHFNTNAYTTAAGNFKLGNLPFDAVVQDAAFYEQAIPLGPYSQFSLGTDRVLTAHLVGGQNSIQFRGVISGSGHNAVDTTDVPASTSGFVLNIAGTYITN
jgi:hypothetical protein